MSKPTASEIRGYLEGYNITSSILSDTWIENTRDDIVIPYIERFTGNLESEEIITEYLSGTGGDILYLSHRNINSIESIEFVRAEEIIGNISVDSVELISGEGILKARTNFSEGLNYILFPRGSKNIKVGYKIGGTIPNDIKTAIKLLTCIEILKFIEGRTGGGSLGVQAFNRQYGNKGKYTNIITSMGRNARIILNRYKTAVVGR